MDNYANAGHGPTLQTLDIGHKTHMALIDPDVAFWALVEKKKLPEMLSSGPFQKKYLAIREDMRQEMETLRYGLKPSAVYFNPTDRCNLDCDYCYIPRRIRKNGEHMSSERLAEALMILKKYFKTTVPKGRKPQIVFHGAEPLLNREAVFANIERFKNDYNFGIQTNATLLDDEAVSFIRANNIGVGISIDGPDAEVGDRHRKDWKGSGSFAKASAAIEKLRGHTGFNVICTITSGNVNSLTKVVDFLHRERIDVCMLNIIRCTEKRARTVKPDETIAAKSYLKALERTNELYRKTGRKLVVANFANILLGILAPTARRLMCDISPCGGGRCFLAVSASGDAFPCGEFLGLPEFKGGNIFKDPIERILATEQFKKVTGRTIENIVPCKSCSVRHFCGSPCPAEAYAINNGDIGTPGAFCEFHVEQARYAFRLIAEGRQDEFLLDGWDKGTEPVFDAAKLF